MIDMLLRFLNYRKNFYPVVFKSNILQLVHLGIEKKMQARFVFWCFLKRVSMILSSELHQCGRKKVYP
jgi:hypothetical protein